MKTRPYTPGDLVILHQINAASTPGVSEESIESLEKIIGLSTCLVALDDADHPIGFVTLITPGTMAYQSLNLRWFEAWVAAHPQDLIYVDRIALHPKARGQKLGEDLYRAAFAAFEHCDSIGCEINTAPDNPTSHKFHSRMGFERVGEQAFSAEKAVAYYVRRL